MTELWIASANRKKRLELERLLDGFELRTLDDLDKPIELIENETTFAGNAAAKAVPLARVVRGLAIGDDSGLCVDALGGRPGVYSARYAGPDADDRARVDKLLAELEGIDRRSARFVCSICLADPSGIVAEFEGVCDGDILDSPRGTHGFGYDPIFAATGSDDTFAELSANEKDACSHRGKALRQLATFLAEYDQERARP